MPIAPPHWHERPIVWDRLDLATGTPGMVVDVKVDRGYKVDEKGGSGVDGGSLTLNGKKLAIVTIKLKLWTSTHLEKCNEFLAAMFKKKKQHEPMDVNHPILSLHNLRSILFFDVSGPTFPDQDGVMYLTITGKEFAPPPPKPKASATRTPTQSEIARDVDRKLYMDAEERQRQLEREAAEQNKSKDKVNAKLERALSIFRDNEGENSSDPPPRPPQPPKP